MFIDIEKWREIFNTLSRHKLRTALTAFGVFWGIFMLTVLLGAGKGLENGVNEGFPRVTNTVYIWQQGTTQIPYQGMPIGRRDQAQARRRRCHRERTSPSVGFIKGQNSVGIWGGSAAVHRAQIEERRLQRRRAASRASKTSTRCASSQGRSINALDEQQRRKVALIGQRVQGPAVRQGRKPAG